MKYLYDPPLIVKLVFKGSRWNSSSDKVLITFDDGPVPGCTDIILRKLNEFGIRALFFCVGNNIKNNPEIISEIISEGHYIGNHTMNHGILSHASNSILKSEIFSFNELMNERFDYKVKYFRPPHGRLSPRLNSFLNENKLENVMWSLLTYDYKSNLSVVKASMNYIKKNSIIVFHDSIKSRDIISGSIDLLMDVIYKRNLALGAPEECLK